jgi:hypothetical protein
VCVSFYLGFILLLFDRVNTYLGVFFDRRASLRRPARVRSWRSSASLLISGEKVGSFCSLCDLMLKCLVFGGQAVWLVWCVMWLVW